MSALHTEFKFRLYVAGGTANSAHAFDNLTKLCRTHLRDRHGIEVVDVLCEPGRALADGILTTPTLVRLAPIPIRKIIGTLSQAEPALSALGVIDAREAMEESV